MNYIEIPVRGLTFEALVDGPEDGCLIIFASRTPKKLMGVASPDSCDSGIGFESCSPRSSRVL